MLHFLDGVRGTGFLVVLLKFVVSLVLGCIIGLERSYKNRSAGFRTHILVTLGATVASLSGLYLCLEANLPADISRLGAAVVSGLGFLGAGTIIVTKNYTVKGLTTAAGLWTSGIIGLAVGAGFYEGAVIAALLVLLAETTLGGIVNKIKRDPEFRIEVRYEEKTALDNVLRCCKDLRLSITNLHVVSAADNGKPCYRAYVSLRPRTKLNHEVLFKEIDKTDGILGYAEVDMEDER